MKYDCTALSWYEGRGKMFENPPDEKSTPTSGLMPVVPPTDVTLRCCQRLAEMHTRQDTH